MVVRTVMVALVLPMLASCASKQISGSEARAMSPGVAPGAWVVELADAPALGMGLGGGASLASGLLADELDR